MEARIGADVYNEQKLLNEFLYGSGDSHAAYAKEVFKEELKDIDVKDIEAKRPDLRQQVKSIEFAVQFGSDGTAVAPQLNKPVEECRKMVSNLLEGMKGLARFKEWSSKAVQLNGFVEAMPATGHRVYWYDKPAWDDFNSQMDTLFWQEYRTIHKPCKDEVWQKVVTHNKARSAWERNALNIPTQGGGAVVLKTAVIQLYNWIVDNGYFGKILLVNFTHDEINSEYPQELTEYPKLVAKIMKDAAAIYYHKLPIPAKAAVGDHWIH